MIVVENSGLFKKATEDLAEYFKAPAPSVCFVFVETEVDKRGRLYKAVRDTGRVVEFARQNEATLQKWILIQLKKKANGSHRTIFSFFSSGSVRIWKISAGSWKSCSVIRWDGM